MVIKRHPMARSEAIRSGELEISRAPFEISHDLRRHRVVRVGEHLWGEGVGRRSEHLYVGTCVRVGEHPKQIGLAQQLARAAPW